MAIGVARKPVGQASKWAGSGGAGEKRSRGAKEEEGRRGGEAASFSSILSPLSLASTLGDYVNCPVSRDEYPPSWRRSTQRRSPACMGSKLMQRCMHFEACCLLQALAGAIRRRWPSDR